MSFDQGVEWPARRARINADHVALRQDDRALTYGQLAARVDQLGAALQGLGVGRGDRVAYLGENDMATFEFFFATARIGALFVPLNTRLTAPELSVLIADHAPSVLVRSERCAEIAAAVAPPSAPVLAVDHRPPAGSALAPVAVGLADPCLVLYTSGTTGVAKGAVLTHGNLTWNTVNQLAHADFLESDIALGVAPLFHVTGLGQVTLPTLFKGATVIVAPRFDAGWLLGHAAPLGLTSFSAVPTMLQMLCDHPAWEHADLSSLRLVIYGGSAVPERVARAWLGRGIQVLQGYGMTEASPGVFLAVADGARERPVSIGVPHFFSEIAHLGPDGPVPVAAGVEAELLVDGPTVFSGYWNRPEPSAASRVEGWFRTGDVVRVDPDGWGYAVDRVKDMIISGGENIYPAEVEAALLTMPGVADCAVVAVSDERWGEVGAAMITTDPGVELTADVVRAFLRERLAGFKVPKHVTFVDRLPRNATGKLLRARLREEAGRAVGD